MPWLWRVLGGLLLLTLLWAGYVLTGQPVTLVINGQSYPLRLHQQTVAGVIGALNLTLRPEDRIQPPLEAALAPGQTITIELARPVTIEADGHSRHILTHQTTVAGVLAELSLSPGPRDKIIINGLTVSAELPLPSADSHQVVVNSLAGLLAASFTPVGAVASTRAAPLRLILRRAVPLTLHDGEISTTLYATQPNVGEALLEQGLTIFPGDLVMPGLDTRLSPGMQVYIQRSTPVAVAVDGRLIQTRTRRQTVGEVLAQEGVALMGQDYSRPAANQPLTANETIEVVRVWEVNEIEAEYIPFETEWIPDEAMEIDQTEVRQPGVTGVIKSRTRVRYENGQEVVRKFEDKWLDQSPSKRIVAYGTNILIRTIETPDGPLEYWRRIAVLLTPYTAATSGKASDHPLYGITASGVRVSYGMAAVDPKVIPLGTKMYVPNYGEAVAADTGGLIVGKHVDLAFEEGQPIPDLYGWGDVYILTPVPPAGQIRYVLPQYPQR
ncbi:MAG: ubiquitin-like domain-containing protein [Anaerolineae bacterium]